MIVRPKASSNALQ